MEFGPRALGARSILGDPRSPKMQADMNIKIKFREGFRPFAPSVLRERVSDYFELDADSPYMLLVAPVKKERCIPLTDAQHQLWGIDKLNVPRSDIPGNYAHRLLGPHPDRDAGHQSSVLRPHRGVRGPYWLRRAGEHVVQRPRRTNRVHAGRCVSLFHANEHRCAGAGSVRSGQGRPTRVERVEGHGSRSSSSTDGRVRGAASA